MQALDLNKPDEAGSGPTTPTSIASAGSMG